MAKLRAYEVNAIQELIVNKLKDINANNLLPKEDVKKQLFADHPQLIALEATLNEIKVLEKKVKELESIIENLPLKEIADKENIHLSSYKGEQTLINKCIKARRLVNAVDINKEEIKNKIIIANLGGETAQAIIDEIVNSLTGK